MTRAEGTKNIKDLRMPSPTTSVVSSPSVDPRLKTKLAHFKRYCSICRKGETRIFDIELCLHILGVLFYNC